MRRTTLKIAERSKVHFHLSALPDLLRDNAFDHLVRGIGKNDAIDLAEGIQSADELEPLIRYLESRGIPRADIHIRFSGKSTQDLIGEKLALGVRHARLNFGEDVAEKDAALSSYFIRTQAADRVRQHQRHVIVGPKGSGKSAILRVLSGDAKNVLVITPEHYATNVLDAIVKSPVVTEVAAYATTWKYTLLIEIFRRVVQNEIGDSRARAVIRKYLVDQGHLSSNLTLFERFVAYLRRISQVKGKVGPAEAALAVDPAEELGKLFRLDELLGLIPELTVALRLTTFTVYLDELDQPWNNTETANRFLISLLTAAIQLRGLTPNLHVVVFLRSEIFDLLKPHLPQLDKLRSDIETLQWSHRELGNLMVSRALHALELDADITAEGTLRLLFSGHVDPSRVGTFEYLLSRTSRRPREVIQLANLALGVAARQNARAVTPEAVLEAEEVFSTWKFEHIVAENMFVFPRLDIVLERFRGSPRLMHASGIDGVLTQLILEAEQDPVLPQWLRGREPVDVLRLLYQFEVIGVEKVGQHTRDDRRLWDFFDFVFTRPKAKPELSTTFLLHPGLWKALEIA